MLNAEVDVNVIRLDSKSAYRLIPSRFPPIEIYDRLGLLEASTAKQIEALTNPRLRDPRRDLTKDTKDAMSGDAFQNWNHAPFVYPNRDGTRFFDRWTPAIELAADLQTALAISVGKRTRFLTASQESAINLDMRVLKQSISGSFLKHVGSDSDLSEDDRRQIGRKAREGDLQGIFFQPSERRNATGYAVIDQRSLGRAVQAAHFRFVWDGTRISTIYSFQDGREIDPANLANADEAA